MSDDVNISKGRGFSVVALSGVGHMHAKGKDEQEAVWVFFVAPAWVTHRLVIGIGELEAWKAAGMCGPCTCDLRELTKSLAMAISINWRKTYVGR